MDSVSLKWSPDDIPGAERKEWYDTVHTALGHLHGSLIATLRKREGAWSMESVSWGLGTREGGTLSFNTQTDLQERELALIIVRALRSAGKPVNSSPRLANVPCFSNNLPSPAERERWNAAVQAGLEGAIGKIASYCVTAAQSTSNIEVKLTVPGNPERTLRLEFREPDQGSAKVAEVLRGVVASAGI